jgi:hypothetical protein
MLYGPTLVPVVLLLNVKVSAFAPIETIARQTAGKRYAIFLIEVLLSQWSCDFFWVRQRGRFV